MPPPEGTAALEQRLLARLPHARSQYRAFVASASPVSSSALVTLPCYQKQGIMATGVLMSYPATSVHQSHPVVLRRKRDLCIRHCKSDPVLATLPRTSYLHAEAWDSIEDLALQTDAVLTIEGLKLQYNSCFTCGVSWYQDHLSLDCSECGGYAMRRPCVSCDGRCKSVWTRDLAATHELRRAQWEGQCTLESPKATTSGKETIEGTL